MTSEIQIGDKLKRKKDKTSVLIKLSEKLHYTYASILQGSGSVPEGRAQIFQKRFNQLVLY